MPSTFRTQKNLPEWVELDYYQRERRLRRLRRILIWTVLIVCVVGVSVASMFPGAKRAVQAGPVSNAHAMFNDQCSRCHQEQFQTAKKLVAGDMHGAVVPDKACIQCHDGPRHNALVAEDIACATCHREHRGREALKHVPDGQCTSCHAELKNHRKGGAEGLIYGDVTSFATDHPPFRVHQNTVKDPGKLHFNHKAHMKPEGILGRGGKTEVLQCIECHTPDSAGRYMQPISYEKHCAECHPLSVRLAGTFAGPEPDELKRSIREFHATPAPHKEPTVVRAVLRERLLEFVQKHPMVAGEKPEKLIDPDNFRSPVRRLRNPSDIEWNWTRDRLGTLEKLLFPEDQRAVNEQVLFQNGGGCRFCHVEEKKRPAGGTELSGLPTFELTNPKTRWMPSARFSHERHRMLNCTECHDARTSEKTSDVLMPTIQSCRECHNPTKGVRHDCAECHTYHDRKTKHERHKTLSIQECLGKP